MTKKEKAKKHFDEAIKAYNRKDYNATRNNFEKAIRYNPNDAKAYNSLALVLATYFKEYEKAKQYFEKALEINPDFADIYYNFAVLLVEHFQKYEKAKQYFEKAIEINPNNTEVYYNIADLLENHFQEYEKAKQYYEKAIKINPNNSKTYYNFAILLVEHFKDYKKAKQYYEKAIEINPNNVKAYNNLALLLENHFQEYEKAKQYYEKAIELNPNLIIAYKNLANLLEKYFQDKNEEKSLKSPMLISGDLKPEKQLKDKIDSISIKNFKIFKNLTVKFTKGINIILAKNGFGKTSFLQALTLANTDDKNSIKDFKSFLSFGSEKADIVLQRNNKALEVTVDEYKKKTLNKYILESPQVCLSYGVNIFTKYEQYNYDGIINDLITGTGKLHHTESIFSDFSLNFFDPLIILNKLSDYMGDKAVLSIRDFIISKINQLIPEYEIIAKDVNKTHYFRDKNTNADGLTTKNLSEGYRSNIILLTDIIIRIISLRKKFNYENLESLFNNVSGIILIDEFDRHLHPLWQKVYLKNLKSVLKNMQFVLTTHNPVAILGRKYGEVQEFYFDKEDNLIKSMVLPETETLDAGIILLKHFGLDSILSIDLQNKIDRFYEIKTKDEISKDEQTELSKLEDEITDTYVGVNIHDYRFLIFIKFLKQRGYDTRERLRELTLTEEEMKKLEKEFENYYADK